MRHYNAGVAFVVFWGLVVGDAIFASHSQEADPVRLVGRWIGQDGTDRVGPSSTGGPSDVQDIHIAVTGIPANRTIVGAKVAAEGGGEWVYKGPYGPWMVDVVHEPGASRADLFLEPAQVETGRTFTVTLTYDDGRSQSVLVAGGRADPNRRTPAAALEIRWIGQEAADHTGLGPSVGPDGIVDVRLELSGLSPKIEVRSIVVGCEGSPGWEYGVNHQGRHNAHLKRRSDDPSKADLSFTPDRDLRGRALSISIDYANGKSDSASIHAATTDPSLRVPRATLPRLVTHAMSVAWLGQDGTRPGHPGDVRLSLQGLATNPKIVAAVMSGGARGTWFLKAGDHVPIEPEPYARPLAFARNRTDPTRADLYFAPLRDESDATMTLRLAFADGTLSVVQFRGGACDPLKCLDARLPEMPVLVRPGDDWGARLAAPANLRLARGEHRLSSPLVLQHSTRISAEPGAIVRFEQPAGSSPWREAISIRSGGVELTGFAVRFAGPIRWEPGIAYGPAVIGTSAPAAPELPFVDLTLRELDLASPPGTDPNRWEEAARLIRLTDAAGGRIEGCKLRGGPIELRGGPWQVVGNESRGTPRGLFSHAVVTGHNTHDLIVRANRVRPGPDSGKTWRFLVLAGSGTRDVIEGNQIAGVGPRDGDAIPNMNAPELILTESYRLKFEGRPLFASPDGRLVGISAPQGESPAAGDVLAVLSGPSAGRWSRVAQAIDSNTLLLEEPLTIGDGAISITTGFVRETFARNEIEARGGSGSVHLVLGGNHFGTAVVGNRFEGAGGGFKITACPTERPVHWGWSHAPMLDLRIEGNSWIDPLHGGLLAVEHGPEIKSNRDRVYLTAVLRDNALVATPAFRTTWPGRPEATAPRPIDVGDPDALDPGELRVGVIGNRREGESRSIGDAVNVRQRAAQPTTRGAGL